MNRPDMLATRVPRPQADDLRESFEVLKALPFRIKKQKESDAHTWSAQSLGEPTRMGELNPLEAPSRVRFIERWLKGGGIHAIGQVKIDIQYVFEGTSMFDEDDPGDEDDHIPPGEAGVKISEAATGSLLVLESEPDMVTGARIIRPDISIRSLYKLYFLSDGTARGVMRRTESDEVPYLVGLDDGVDTSTLQAFGREVQLWQPEYSVEPVGIEAARDLGATLRHFSDIEARKINDRINSGAVYYQP